MKQLSTALLLLVLAPSLSFGALGIAIDAIGKTYSLTGSTSGTPNNPGGFGEAFFSLAGSGSPVVSDVINDTSVISVDSGALIGANFVVADDGSIDFNINTTATTPVTLTGTGTTVSYAGFAAALQTILESSDGSILSLNTGSGFESIEITVVPEPGQAGLLVGLATGLLLLRRRARR